MENESLHRGPILKVLIRRHGIFHHTAVDDDSTNEGSGMRSSSDLPSSRRVVAIAGRFETFLADRPITVFELQKLFPLNVLMF